MQMIITKKNYIVESKEKLVIIQRNKTFTQILFRKISPIKKTAKTIVSKNKLQYVYL